jgi:thiamine-monophosphate kinase
MGAAPRYATLALTLPAVDNDWLAEFSAGFFALADRSDIELIGGDTTRGPLSITVTVMGAIKVSGALRRDTAQAGDDIWVSGTLGGAAAALRHLQRKVDLPRETLRPAQAKLERPEPRNALGERLVDVAHAAIDISDGLIADLGHICERSRLCANVDLTSVPRDAALTNIDARVALECMLTGGDDYELCFTVPPAKRGEVVAISRELNLPLTRIGHMCEGAPSAVVRDANGGILHLDAGGFDHFPGHVDAS